MTEATGRGREHGRTRGAALALAGIDVRFGAVVALSDVSLTVPAGAVFGVIGPNGAGKTTLFNVICGLVRPDRGSMSLDGAPWRPRPERLTEAGIARTLQGVGLFDSLTVLENVATGLRPRPGALTSLLGLRRTDLADRRIREQAFAALSALQIQRYGDDYPPTLPAAVRKKVALARALVAHPRLLLLDEPAGGLSGAEIDELAATIAALPARGCTVLLVEHHLDLVMTVCDRVAVLDSGRLIASGEPAAVRADPAVTRAYLGEGG